MLEEILSIILAWGWLIVAAILMWVIWQLYRTIKMIDYVTGVEWTFLQITVPEEAEQTPKAMENTFDTWDGIHKNPDLIEKYFDGLLEAWYSCEIHCTKGRARYIMVVPTVHRTFFEGVIYGQYPQAEITEVEDYTQRYAWPDLEKKFDLFGSEFILAQEDYFPVKTYHEYEDTLAEDDHYVDPHQALIEAYTNVNEGEEFWVQILVRPVDSGTVTKWAEEAAEMIDELAGKEVVKSRGLVAQVFDAIIELPGALVRAAVNGPEEAGRSNGRGETTFPKVSELDRAKMEGIVRKISNGGYKTKIRIIYLSEVGKLHKPNVGRAIGGLKQFNTFHLNSFRPDPETKSNAPDYILKDWRRYWRKRRVFLNFQWRDFWGVESGFFMSSEELATLYHFPVKYVKAPAVERAKAGSGGPPDNVPYV